MSLDGLVAQVGQLLGDARGLYGPAPQSGGWSSTAGLRSGRDGVAQAGGVAQGWGGAASSTHAAANGRVDHCQIVAIRTGPWTDSMPRPGDRNETIRCSSATTRGGAPSDETRLDNREALTAALDDLLARKPHLDGRRPSGWVGQGRSQARIQKSSPNPSVDLAAILRGRTR